jgi:hypothetical protein
VTIRPGDEWGRPTTARPDVEVSGDDAALASAVAAAPGALVRWIPEPTADLARALGVVRGTTPQGHELPLDALRVGEHDLACNMAVLGPPPDALRRVDRRIALRVEVDGRPWFAGAATTVVVAVGEFLRGLDVVPRGHPGDGRAEVQVYCLKPRERAEMRARLATGTHLPHPRIAQRVARRVSIEAAGTLAFELDGHARPAAGTLVVEVVPGAYRLLV